jgi:hypothetical protein
MSSINGREIVELKRQVGILYRWVLLECFVLGAVVGCLAWYVFRN